MKIQRPNYLNKLISKRGNGLIKIVTGIRRCGKSYLLCNLFHEYLLNEGVDEKHIIEIALDDRRNKELRDPDKMIEHIDSRIKDDKMYYLILDEVQYLNEFEDVLNSFLHIPNVDVYVTGSNSKFLSSDIITEFRGRGDEIRIYPLSFSEYVSVFNGSIDEAWDDYFNYGGLPFILNCQSGQDKMEYLISQFNRVYISDITERHIIQNEEEFDELLDILASAIGSLTNPLKLSNTFKSVKGKNISDKTIKKYLDYLIDAFLVSKAKRYDIKGKKYINSPAKYYFEDIGLRNARIGFRQTEENHIMENVIYNELRIRGFHVDVGLVEHISINDDKKAVKKQLEVDFVATKGNKKYYIQSAFAMSNLEKLHQEQRSLLSIPDSFKKIIVVRDNIKVRRDNQGIATIGLYNFLLDENSLDL